MIYCFCIIIILFKKIIIISTRISIIIVIIYHNYCCLQLYLFGLQQIFQVGERGRIQNNPRPGLTSYLPKRPNFTKSFANQNSPDYGWVPKAREVPDYQSRYRPHHIQQVLTSETIFDDYKFHIASNEKHCYGTSHIDIRSI